MLDRSVEKDRETVLGKFTNAVKKDVRGVLRNKCEVEILKSEEDGFVSLYEKRHDVRFDRNIDKRDLNVGVGGLT